MSELYDYSVTTHKRIEELKRERDDAQHLATERLRIIEELKLRIAAERKENRDLRELNDRNTVSKREINDRNTVQEREIHRLRGVVRGLQKRLGKYICFTQAPAPSPDTVALVQRVKDLEIAVAKLIGTPHKCDWCGDHAWAPHYDRFGKQNVCEACYVEYNRHFSAGASSNCFNKTQTA